LFLALETNSALELSISEIFINFYSSVSFYQTFYRIAHFFVKRVSIYFMLKNLSCAIFVQWRNKAEAICTSAKRHLKGGQKVLKYAQISTNWAPFGKILQIAKLFPGHLLFLLRHYLCCLISL